MQIKTILYFILFFNLLISINYSQDKGLVGKIEGFIIDAESKTELIGANILLVNTTIGAATDIKGKFIIENAFIHLQIQILVIRKKLVYFIKLFN